MKENPLTNKQSRCSTNRNDLTDEQKRWFAFYVKPNCERKVLADMEKAAIEGYLPLQHQTRIWGGKKRKVQKPLIRSYVFAKVNRNEYYEKIRYMQKIVKIVTIGTEIICITENEINWLKALETNNATIEMADNSRIIIGQRVKIANGLYAGLEGNVIKEQGKNRFGIVIESLQTAFLLDISAEDLIAIG